uniref:Phage gp6-like head-tail connector protein n=1 Tax=biofilter metagenome TaxID=1070537 RepID=A0A1A7GE34_9ZZZZ
MPAVKPSLEEALLRLRLDPDLSADVTNAIPQVFAETVRYLDGPLFQSAEEATASADPKAIVSDECIIAAQLLLIDALVGTNTTKEAAEKRGAAYSMLRMYRNQGA